MAPDFDYEKTRTYDTEEGFDKDSEFRRHYEATFADGEHSYDTYVSAYRYGYDLATDARYTDDDWQVIEETARVDWMESYGDDYDWDVLRDAVRYGWELGQAKVNERNEKNA